MSQIDPHSPNFEDYPYEPDNVTPAQEEALKEASAAATLDEDLEYFETVQSALAAADPEDT